MRNPALFAVPLAAILGGLSLLHAYWALGGRWGSAYVVPVIRGKRSFEPTPLAPWIICGPLAVAVILVIGKAGWIGTGPLLVLFDAGVWGLSFVFVLRAIGNLGTFGFFKTITGTPFARWDTWLYSPLCLMIAIMAACLAWLPQRR
jgi:hypothetical protein